jgi:uncharacterized protein (DUF1015 family)
MRVFAFEGYRYRGDAAAAGAEAAPPYDQINAALRDRLHAQSPHQFAHLITPLAADGRDAYAEAAHLHEAWRSEGVVERDPEPSLYPYEIRLAGGGARLGLAALVGIEDPGARVIRAHEQTLDKPLADRLDLMRATRVDLEPALLLPDDGGALDTMLAEDVAGREPLADHRDAEGHHHRLFRFADPARIKRYRELLAPLPAAIADGHHRYKTATLYARETGAPRDSAAAAKLAVITSLQAENLTIDPIHRALREPHDLTSMHARLRSRATSSATTGADFAADVAAADQPAIGIWRHGGTPEIWGLDPALAPKSRTASAARLPVVLLAEGIFPALGLAASASTDGTVVYRSDPDELQRMVIAGEVALGFFLPPMSPNEFGAAIANGDLLPPKSTRFLPKVFSGLVWSGHDGRTL